MHAAPGSSLPPNGHLRGETARLPGMTLTDFWFEVPLDHFKRDVTLAHFEDETIKVFVREIVSTGRENWRQPALLYLEGGPGFQAPRPLSRSGWLQRALEEYRVYLLDQRGCGLSTQISCDSLRSLKPKEQAAFFCLFRADSIVADCEVIRRELLGEQGRWTLLAQSYGGFISMRYLSVAPQAIEVALFAGALPPIGVPIHDVYRATYKRLLERNRRYYERYPMDVRRVREILDFLTQAPVALPGGGLLTSRRFLQLGLRLGTSAGFETLHFMLESSFLPPYCVYVMPPPAPSPTVVNTATQVEDAAIAASAANTAAAESTTVASRELPAPSDENNKQSDRDDAEAGSGQAAVVDTISSETAIAAPSPSDASPVSSTQKSGDRSPVASPAAAQASPSAGAAPPWRQTRRMSPNFLHAVVNWQPFELQPIYTVLQEAIYMGDGSRFVTKWAAHQVMKEFPEFAQWQQEGDWNIPAYFTGEMIYPWMFDGDYEHLEPLRDAARIISEKDDWPMLYDINALRSCKVPCAAAVYYEDMYVESGFSEDTGRMLPHCKMWITNEYQHSGLQDDGYNIMVKLLNIVRGGLQIPS